MGFRKKRSMRKGGKCGKHEPDHTNLKGGNVAANVMDLNESSANIESIVPYGMSSLSEYNDNGGGLLGGKKRRSKHHKRKHKSKKHKKSKKSRKSKKSKKSRKSRKSRKSMKRKVKRTIKKTKRMLKRAKKINNSLLRLITPKRMYN